MKPREKVDHSVIATKTVSLSKFKGKNGLLAAVTD